jgi:cell division protein FtsB
MRYRRFTQQRFSAGTRVKFDNSPSKLKMKKLLWILVFLVISYFFLAGNRGLISLVKMKLEKHGIEKEVEMLEEQNKLEIREIQGLKQDLKTIERIAREDLGLVKKGEVVFRFVTPDESGK